MQAAARRRWIFALAALVLACGAALYAWQRREPVRRIGFLGMESAMQATRVAAFRDGMRSLGYIEGRNLIVEYRSAEGDFGRLPALAQDLVRQDLEVIVTAAPPPVRALQQATTRIPIVMSVHDPVGMGFARSLAHPGGNITGVAFQDWELSTKRLDLFRGVVPNLGKVAIVWNEAGGGARTLTAVEDAARSMGIATRAFEVRGPDEIANVVAAAKAWGAQGIVQLASPVITANRERLLAALAEHRMPASCELRLYVEEGCLMTYSADLDAMFREMAAITARILKGARPQDLAIVQPREFDFVINMRTAEALGLVIPEVIQLQTTDRIR
jgi:putative tryptophan/tyrosine transport system substrate-binding protein